MINYKIEGDIDFFKELHGIKNSNESESTQMYISDISTPTGTTIPMSVSIDEMSDDNKCLLTGDTLLPDHVKLECGHTFNYQPLFKEVLFQKCAVLPKNMSSFITTSYVKINYHKPEIVSHNYNSSVNMETNKLQYNEVKCPYCRTITPFLLPYYPYPNVKQVRYVNSPTNLCLPGVKCEYFTKKNQSKTCNCLPTYHETHGMICKTHLKVVSKITTDENIKVPPSKLSSSKTVKDNSIMKDTCSYILVSGIRKGCPCGQKASSALLTGMNIEHNNTENIIVHMNPNVLLCKRHSHKINVM